MHGLPESIVADRDKIFASTVWKGAFRLINTQLLMSSSYHPQKDGQSERLNQCLEAFLCCSVHSCPRQWNKWLALENALSSYPPAVQQHVKRKGLLSRSKLPIGILDLRKLASAAGLGCSNAAAVDAVSPTRM